MPFGKIIVNAYLRRTTSSLRQQTALRKFPRTAGISRLSLLGVRIFVRSKFNSERCALEFELVSEPSFQISPVAFRNILKCVAVNHNDRRILTALVCVSHLRTSSAGSRRQLTSRSFNQSTGQLRCGELHERGCVSIVDGIQQVMQTALFKRGDINDLRPA